MTPNIVLRRSGVDRRLDNAISKAFGDPINPFLTPNKKEEVKRPPRVIHHRLAYCPRCNTIGRHPVEKVVATGTQLECLWCYRLFNVRRR